MIGYDVYKSPVGNIYVVVNDIGVCRVELFEDSWLKYLKDSKIQINKELCKEAITQIEEYFLKKRKVFDLALDIRGTEFRKKVWNELSNIPYGKTATYQQIASMIGNPKAVRAVGQANRANEIPIIIPCHRVIGSDGKLVGFAGDKIWLKEWLLKHEGFEV